jgi:hypothetical protein
MMSRQTSRLDLFLVSPRHFAVFARQAAESNAAFCQACMLLLLEPQVSTPESRS